MVPTATCQINTLAVYTQEVLYTMEYHTKQSKVFILFVSSLTCLFGGTSKALTVVAGLEDEDDDDVAAPAPRQEQRQDRDFDDGLEEEDEFADFLDYDDEGGAPGEGRRRRRDRAQGLPPGISSAAFHVRTDHLKPMVVLLGSTAEVNVGVAPLRAALLRGNIRLCKVQF